MVRNLTIAALMLAACSVCANAESFDGTVAFTYATGPQDDWMGCFQKARYNAAVKLEADQFPGYKVVGVEGIMGMQSVFYAFLTHYYSFSTRFLRVIYAFLCVKRVIVG